MTKRKRDIPLHERDWFNEAVAVMQDPVAKVLMASLHPYLVKLIKKYNTKEDFRIDINDEGMYLVFTEYYKWRNHEWREDLMREICICFCETKSLAGSIVVEFSNSQERDPFTRDKNWFEFNYNRSAESMYRTMDRVLKKIYSVEPRHK